VKQLSIRPELHKFATCREFAEQFKLGEGDLIITNAYIYNPVFGALNIKAEIVFQEKYGAGEPSDEMAEAIYRDIGGGHKRIIAIGGGTVIDISKLFALKKVVPILDLYDKKTEIKKDKELIIVPTTCGTGSEVTNLSILELKSRHTKMGLASDELYADYAVLIPELLGGLPPKVFATSSIDALIHAVESAVSPKATAYTKLFSYKAIEMIVKGYQRIAADGDAARSGLMEDFLVASNYAGIAFGNAGCGAVHAMSYPLGAKFHIAHGESNYALFTGVFKNYLEISKEGKIAELDRHLAGLLGCDMDAVFQTLDTLLGRILEKKRLGEYGVAEKDLAEFTDVVMKSQGRLMANNFVTLDAARVRKIYDELI
jgi:4-hydroxybutyrate dehydrogenase